MITVLIVEGDPLQALELERIISDSGYQVLDTVDNAEAAQQIVGTQKVNLLVIDISIKGRLNGIELAAVLAPKQIPIIFVTEFEDEQTYLQARRLFPWAYLVKPIKKSTLQSAIETALLHTNDSALLNKMLIRWQEDMILKDYVFLKSSDRVIKVDLSEVAIIEADGNYCIVYLPNEKQVVKMSLKRIRQKVSPRRFLQIHRNFLVQLPFIDSFNSQTETVTILEKQLPVGGTYRAAFLKRLNFLED